MKTKTTGKPTKNMKAPMMSKPKKQSKFAQVISTMKDKDKDAM